MRCFRLSHAGLVIEREQHSLFVDAGNFSDSQELSTALSSAAPIAALVITHEHADHWTPDNVASIRDAAPEAPIYTTQATADALLREGIADNVHVMSEGDLVQAGPFSLEFYGGRHELLHSSIPVIDNIGVHVNGMLAWGGDTLTRAPFAADVLGVPIGSPWSNIAQVMDFVLNSQPRRAYLTHDGMLSDRGLGLFTDRVQWCLDQFGGELIHLPRLQGPGERRYEL